MLNPKHSNMNPLGLSCIPANRLRDELSISKYTEKMLCDQGKLKKIKVGKKTFYRITEVNRLFEEQPAAV